MNRVIFWSEEKAMKAFLGRELESWGFQILSEIWSVDLSNQVVQYNQLNLQHLRMQPTRDLVLFLIASYLPDFLAEEEILFIEKVTITRIIHWMDCEYFANRFYDNLVGVE